MKAVCLTPLLLVALYALVNSSGPGKPAAGKASLFASSESCGSCHQDIYREWSNSLHAASNSDPVFRGVFNRTPESGRRFCVGCHAPMVVAEGSPDSKFPASLDGITCDYCHSVKSVQPGKPHPYELVFDKVKRGPFESADTAGHPSVLSDVHTKAEFCAGCHEAVNAHGLAVLDTYEEWKAGPYPGDGVQCQNCHMPADFNSSVVTTAGYKSDHVVTAHRFLGGHSQINITSAAKMSMLLDSQGNNVTAVVYVTNAESGHRLPTGIPARRVVLEVRVLNAKGKVLDSQKVEYRRVLQDAAGNAIAPDKIEDMFSKAVAVMSDNRISPKETRREEFSFTVSDGADDRVVVESSLYYLFQVPFLMPNEMKMPMARDIQTVRLHRTPPAPK